jgi:hypothetical protein
VFVDITAKLRHMKRATVEEGKDLRVPVPTKPAAAAPGL